MEMRIVGPFFLVKSKTCVKGSSGNICLVSYCTVNLVYGIFSSFSYHIRSLYTFKWLFFGRKIIIALVVEEKKKFGSKLGVGTVLVVNTKKYNLWMLTFLTN